MSVGASDTYEVIFEVRDSPMAAAIEKSVADARRLDAQWQSTINNIRQRTAALGDAAGQNLPKTQSMFGSLGKSAADAGGQITRMAATFLVFQAGRELVAGMRDALSDLRDYTVTINKELTGMQSNIAELQSITGRAGESNAKVIQEQLDLMKYTGMTQQQASAFSTEFAGETASSKDRFREDQFAQIRSQSARFAMIHGGPAEAHAILAARLASMYKPVAGREDQQASDIATQQADIYNILNLTPGLTADVNQSYVTALSRLVSPTGQGGMVGSARELANLTVAAAKPAGSPAQIATFLEQFSRAATGQSRSPQWNKFLRETLQIPAEAPAEVAMVPIFKRLEEVQNSGKSMTEFLKNQGLGNSGERLALVGLFNQRNLYETAKATAAITTGQAQETLTKPYTLSGGRLDLLQGQNEAAKMGVRIEQAQRDQLAEVFRGRAEAELMRRKEIGPEWEATLSPSDRLNMYTQEKIYGKDIIQRTKIDELAMQMARQQFGMKSRGEAEFVPQGRTIAEQMAISTGLDSLVPGMTKERTRYIDFNYTQANRLSQDVNEMADARRFGIDAATGKEMAHPKVLKTLEDISHGVRKDRPMTVAKPAPGVRP